MKRILAGLLLGLSASSMADGSLLDAVNVELEKPKITVTLPYDWQCFQPGVVSLAIRTLDWQRQRITELEAKCGDRCK
jgi:hypothetical protein